VALEREVVQFYRAGEPNGFLSNFARYPVELDGVRWPTSEHAFQAQKFPDAALRSRIAAAPTPLDAARMGRTLPGIRPDWDAVRDATMLRVLRAKFAQHDKLRRRLLETGESALVEHTDRDRYWGDGGDGSGQNRLGALLEQVRAELREALQAAPEV
jgi:ribA/ribD-fused uncharacterized protein